MALQIALCLAGTAFLAYVSRRSLARPGSHGFFRFFAWACIWVLFVLNLPGWFTDPFAIHQLVSWILLLASLVPLALGVAALKNRGASRGQVAESANFAFENTTRLVTSGVYASIRHPMYASLLYLAWGVYAKAPLSIAGIVLAICATLALYLTARKEEAEDIRAFGAEYEEYMKKTKRFIPGIF